MKSEDCYGQPQHTLNNAKSTV